MLREPLHETWIDSNRFVPRRFVRPIQKFMKIEASTGALLLLMAAVAMVWANSPWSDSYFAFWNTPIDVTVGPIHLSETFQIFVNDALMTFFFFVVGLEIKRELVLGRLRDPKAATLPVMAAAGGMLVPALVYIVLVVGEGGEALSGWAVPTATDIAFSLGVLSLVGNRASSGAKLFLLALAIADDVGAIAIIALFYSEDLAWNWLTWGIVTLIVIAVAGRAGIRARTFYIPASLVAWFCVHEAGVHPTLVGVALAFITPARPMYSAEELYDKGQALLNSFPRHIVTYHQREEADHQIMTLAEVARESVAPLARNEHRLLAWSSFLVLPIFALANAGVRIGDDIGQLLKPVAMGTALGLLLGKTVGISLFTWLAVKLGWGRLPEGMQGRDVVALAAVAGIGFTVAIFVSSLAFVDPMLTDQAKLGILTGSLLAGLLGYSIFRFGPRPKASGESAGAE
ncbi:MAG: Na+/H+ antiporter NhaA [bacterium]|nr:Na+/H+ antiporter NhaA [Acidimicrobiia bacterium]MCY4651180.1 Na+/H+ antiporter NhaA [bacterium]